MPYLSRFAACFLVIALGMAPAPPLAAQGRPAVKVETFRSPDGSRFVLVPVPEMVQVHWVVATPAGPAEDPREFGGLSAAILRAAQNGTRRIGSLDPGTETAVLDELDEVCALVVRDPGDAAARERLGKLQARADSLADSRAFTRVLAGAPAHGIEVAVRDSVGLFQLTTLPSAIAEVAEILVDRREEPILRGLANAWVQEANRLTAALRRNPMATLEAEILALALPDHPTIQGPPHLGRTVPRRAQALALWAKTQHPSRAVHVLLGALDPKATRATIDRVFARTTLPRPELIPIRAAAPLRSRRQSTVLGTGRSVVAMAWVLPEVSDPWTLTAWAAWLGDGPSSRLTDYLRRNGRKTATVSCRAPWPVGPGSHGLLVVELRDPAGTAGLAELALKGCAALLPKAPTQGSLHTTAMRLQRDWSVITSDPRWLAAETASLAIRWPELEPSITRPVRVEAADVYALLRETFRGQPVIVEARP